ncbi:hypothetical protein Q75_04415 [Bacillus coahuilensis p1.1.43]|uniref:DUF418 domain-containing protein n=1 Tax=Bacillus coahuilensis p1.1.43 TaxID=1150625 RepID=A0A147KAJ0_9BACI|nr:hypothetical protein Q75_04415 [Bacillus coahuilensis p1.1.43]
MSLKFIQPIGSNERIHSIDIMRGFSLLGIFLVNMIFFHSPYIHYNPYEWWDEPLDSSVYMLIDVFVQSSFYPLFAMLFGFGLALQQQRFLDRGEAFSFFAVRRLFVLLVFGLVHALVIWSGDILTNYAVFGLVLLVTLRWSGATLLSLGLSLWFIPQFLLSGLIFIASIASDSVSTIWTNITAVQDSIQAFSSGSVADIFNQRFSDWWLVNGPSNLVFLFLSIFPMMLIGAGIAKLGWVQYHTDHKKKWEVIFIGALVVGLLLKSLPYIISLEYTYVMIQDSLGGPLVAIMYASLIVLLTRVKRAEKILRPIGQAGKMAFSLYIFQSIIGTLIFYSYGLGLYGQMSLATGSLLAVGIYFIQVIIAGIYLNRFQYGPLEKLWRWLSYGKKTGREVSE